MSHQTDRIRHVLPYLSRGNYNTLMKMLHNSLTFSLSDAAKFRLHVLDHFYKYGIGSTVNAFNIPRTTIYTWKKTYEDSGEKMSSLVPKSTRPHHTRTMTTTSELVEFIKAMRMEFDNIGKLKIKYFLDEYAKEIRQKSYGTTKINLIIKRKGFNFAKRKTKKRVKLLSSRVKRSPKEKLPGYIEMDTVHLWVLGRKHYFITALDVVTRFAWVSLVKSPSSKWATISFNTFEKQYARKHDYPIRVVQTDNGSEFMGEFSKHLQKLGITQSYIYPRSPKVNGYIERFNRTFKEEFLYKYELGITEQKFNQKLTNYLLWYNTKRPHQSLNMKPPTEYIQNLR